MPVHLAAHFEAEKHIPGLLLIRTAISIGKLVEELYLIWDASEIDEYLDKTLFIPL